MFAFWYTKYYLKNAQFRVYLEKFQIHLSHKKVIRYSQYEFLTDLINRYYMEEQAEQAMKDLLYGTMVMLDIDNYKRFNDTYGHMVGEEYQIFWANVGKALYQMKESGKNGIMVLEN